MSSDYRTLSSQTMTRDDAANFAEDWTEAWNRRDIERVLGFFRDDVAFVSPTALAVVGTATIRGKAAVCAYWTQAMSRIGSLKFTLDRVMWDAGTRELAIIYTSDIDGMTRRVSENLVLDENGLVASAEVFHGIQSTERK